MTARSDPEFNRHSIKAIAKGPWRWVRWFLLVACAGGGLAADNTWVGTFNLDFASAGRWFSSEASTDAAEVSVAVNIPAEIAPRAQMSMGGLINGLLFARPAGRWALDSRAVETRSSLARRIVEFDQINPISASDNFSAYQMVPSFSYVGAVSGPVAPTGAPGPNVPAASAGTWVGNSAGTQNWSDSTKWASGSIPFGPGSIADFSNLSLTGDRNITVDTARTVARITIGDEGAGPFHYTMTGVSLTFDNGSPPGILQQTATSNGDTIAVPIFLKSDLDVSNASTSTLTISGSIQSSAATGTFRTVLFDSGNVDVSGAISNGSTGSTVSLTKTGSGTLTLSGPNAYTAGRAFPPGRF